MKTIIRAPHSGFCFGVKQAIEKAVAVKSEKEINTCGPLIHNKRVIEKLKALGIGVVDSPKDAPEGSVIIVRSHGEPERFYREAEARNLEVVDATCPYVVRIHGLVAGAYKEGKQIVIVGDREHPEVIGINGRCEDKAVVISSGAMAEALFEQNQGKVLLENPVFLVAQTTIQKETLEDVKAVFARKGVVAEVKNTICNATTERQKGCKEAAEKSELMLVIGDVTSSNTKKLYDIAKKTCKNTYFIENKADLPLKEIQKYNRIGIAAGASTPEDAIKEVIANMSEQTLENELTMQDFMEEIDKSLRLPRSGELVIGKVHQVTDKEIIVNLGCKKDGIIPLDEISLEGDRKLTDLYSEGDEIQAKVLKTDDGDGTILLSKKKLEAGEHWEEINQALEDKTLIDVDVVRQVNGGVIATYKEVSGFIPLSQLSDRFVEDSSEFVGQTLTVRVSRVDPRRGKAVFSHKAHLNEERQKALEEIWENIHVDDIVEGTVMRFTDYGAFVDIGGIDGLLHISEISWGKLKHPQEVLSIGEKITVKVLSMNAEKGKISLGLKQTQPEPWTVIDEKYHVGDVVKGKVVQIKEYGCFVELEPGLDGLVHISEVNHKRVANINDELNVGQEVDAKILEIDKERKRISLSIKETLDAPAEDAADEVAETEE
ncbi:MAG: bifunctional 4-hydroxy-3-methylbut-2-enyl diphosphate reductase/30S ribosomal protein S1 [Anaerovoracaceae bacterium]